MPLGQPTNSWITGHFANCAQPMCHQEGGTATACRSSGSLTPCMATTNHNDIPAIFVQFHKKEFRPFPTQGQKSIRFILTCNYDCRFWLALFHVKQLGFQIQSAPNKIGLKIIRVLFSDTKIQKNNIQQIFDVDRASQNAQNLTAILRSSAHNSEFS